MSSIAANINPERTNRWLLIGAVALAVIAGILIFAALANVGGNDEGTGSSIAGGDSPVLVANDTIAAGTKLQADMFRTASFSEENLVPGALTDPDAVIGLTASTEILKGAQLSRSYIAEVSDDERVEQTAFKIRIGERGVSVSVNSVTGVSGLLVPGDHVDVIVTTEVRDSFNSERKFVRTSTLLQNVEVIAREQTDVVGGTTVDEDGNPVAPTTTDDGLGRRPDDIDPDGSLSTITLSLTPEAVNRLVIADHLGDVTLSLRPFGDDEIRPIEDTVIEVFD